MTDFRMFYVNHLPCCEPLTLRYLFKTYKVGDTVKESMMDYSTNGASKDHGTIR